MNSITEAETIHKQYEILYMTNELIKNTEYQGITSAIKFFDFAISKINFFSEEQSNKVIISKNEIYNIFELKVEVQQSRFRNKLKDVVKDTVVYLELENGIEIVAPIINKIMWNKKEDFVTVVFEKDFMPYLQFHDNSYTKFLLSHIMNLKHAFSVPLFKSFSMNIKIYNSKPFNNNLCYKNPFYSEEKIRELTGTKNKYKNVKSLTRDVVKKIVVDINENTNLTVEYEYLREKKGYQFYIDLEEIFLDLPSGNANQELKDKENLEKLPEALTNKYIQSLINKEIIKYTDIQEICNIYVEVVPIYEKVDSEYITFQYQRSHDVIERHINYLSKFMIENNVQNHHKNITQYLLRAVNDFINKLESNRIEYVEKVK